MTSDQIARATQVPSDYAVKVLQALARAGYVKAQRGRGGGFRATCDPAETTLMDIISAIDDDAANRDLRPVDMPMPPVAALRAHVVEVLSTARASFRNTTIDEITARANDPATVTEHRGTTFGMASAS